ncbi:hypothetical protein F441_21828 [Phytophthora nicotianae CJ01A1]|uniref:Uncharacterized protein n=2 Tax=Phytophthora nicotianae TaxID=4792 RepID=W2VRF1_PHYNI|nr:hypothetical protein F444_21962 [Phytophthora nicotianae P1976]ETP00835.1 hypothetical protein F441_21828 [Phytophthora nicotianae CJ01A1]
MPSSNLRRGPSRLWLRSCRQLWSSRCSFILDVIVELVDFRGLQRTSPASMLRRAPSGSPRSSTQAHHHLLQTFQYPILMLTRKQNPLYNLQVLPVSRHPLHQCKANRPVPFVPSSTSRQTQSFSVCFRQTTRS